MRPTRLARPARPIALLTDFGLADPYAGQVTGLRRGDLSLLLEAAP